MFTAKGEAAWVIIQIQVMGIHPAVGAMILVNERCRLNPRCRTRNRSCLRDPNCTVPRLGAAQMMMIASAVIGLPTLTCAIIQSARTIVECV